MTSAISGRGGATFKTGPYGGGDASDDSSSHQWVLYALDAASGRILWQTTADEGRPRDKRHVKSTYASSTPATDGRVVVAWFGSQALYAYTVGGTPLWKVDLGRVSVGAVEAAAIEWGPASSPVIWEGLVILQVDTHADSFLIALSVDTGEQVWKTEREEIPSCSSPTVVTAANGAELILNGANLAIGAGGFGIVTSGGMGSPRPIVAVRHGARGDLSPADPADKPAQPSGLVWSLSGRGSFTATPLAYRGLLYVLANNGVLDVYDIQTGADLFAHGCRRSAAVSAHHRLLQTARSTCATRTAGSPSSPRIGRSGMSRPATSESRSWPHLRCRAASCSSGP